MYGDKSSEIFETSHNLSFPHDMNLVFTLPFSVSIERFLKHFMLFQLVKLRRCVIPDIVTGHDRHCWKYKAMPTFPT